MPTVAGLFFALAVVRLRARVSPSVHCLGGLDVPDGFRPLAWPRNIRIAVGLEQPGQHLDYAARSRELDLQTCSCPCTPSCKSCRECLRTGESATDSITEAPGSDNFAAAGMALALSGLLRLAEFFVQRGAGGIS